MGSYYRRHIPERFLRQLWQHQLFTASSLSTTGGERVEILSPGVVNRDSGPDFLDARVRIGGVLTTGNIELHRCGTDWTGHGHHLDPLYNAVVLHVVFQRDGGTPACRTRSRRQVPVLVLEHYLAASYHDLWREMISSERSERLPTLPCFPENAGVAEEEIRAWLSRLAMERMEMKIRRNEQRLRELLMERRLAVGEPRSRYEEIGFRVNPEELPAPEPLLTPRDYAAARPWEQLLFEGIMTALGYSKNQEQMLRLARHLSVEALFHLARESAEAEAVPRIEAILFRAAGLLNSALAARDRESREMLRFYRALAASVRHPPALRLLHDTEWKFFRLRPENFPTVRLAGAARLIVRFAGTDFLKSVIRELKRDDAGAEEQYRSLRAFFLAPAAGYWASHYRFGQRSQAKIRALIGPSRADEIILNTIIPVALLYARTFRDGALRRRVLSLFDACPADSPSSITLMMERQLARGHPAFKRAPMTQGCYQLYRAYCLEDRCSECAVGKIVFGEGEAHPAAAGGRRAP